MAHFKIFKLYLQYASFGFMWGDVKRPTEWNFLGFPSNPLVAFLHTNPMIW